MKIPDEIKKDEIKKKEYLKRFTMATIDQNKFKKEVKKELNNSEVSSEASWHSEASIERRKQKEIEEKKRKERIRRRKERLENETPRELVGVKIGSKFTVSLLNNLSPIK